MAVYEWPELISRWRRGEIDIHQLAGQLLQWGQQTHETTTRCANRQAALERQVATLVQRVEALEGQIFPKAKG